MKKIFAMMIVAAGCMVFASCTKTEEKKDGAAAEGTEQVAEGENAEEAPVEGTEVAPVEGEGEGEGSEVAPVEGEGEVSAEEVVAAVVEE